MSEKNKSAKKPKFKMKKGTVYTFMSLILIIAAYIIAANVQKDGDNGTPNTGTEADVIQTTEEQTTEAAQSVTEQTTEAAQDTTEQTTDAAQDTTEQTTDAAQDATERTYTFRYDSYRTEHFKKHGGEFEPSFGYETAADYEAGANRVINSPDALHKTEAEDGDDIYYLEATNEFVVVSTDGYIRTYFRPTAGIDYYNRQ